MGHRVSVLHLPGSLLPAEPAIHAERLLSLALLEPSSGNQRSGQEEALQERFRALERLPPEERMAEFARLQVAPASSRRRVRSTPPTSISALRACPRPAYAR